MVALPASTVDDLLETNKHCTSQNRAGYRLCNEGKVAQSRNRRLGREMSVGRLGLALAIGSAGALLFAVRPRDPIFEVVSIKLKGFKLRFCTHLPTLLAVIDVELWISIKVTNPNVVPIEYSSTVMDIYYLNSLLGQAQVSAGSQSANCSQILEVPAKMDGLEVTRHLKDVIKDIAKREMSLKSVVSIKGNARIWKWTHKFEVHVESHIKVDPIFLDVIEQENKAHLELHPL